MRALFFTSGISSSFYLMIFSFPLYGIGTYLILYVKYKFLTVFLFITEYKMTEPQIMIVFIILMFITTVGITVFLVKRSNGNARLYWFIACVMASFYLVGYLVAPFSTVISLLILFLMKNEKDNALVDIKDGLFHLIAFSASGLFFVIYGLLAIGGFYWLWMAIQLGSFWMFIVGVFPLSFLVTVPVGAYSLIFGMPDWVISFFG